MFLAPIPADALARRKTAYDLALVEVGGVLVSADARLPNTLLREAVDAGRVPAFADYDEIRAEVRLGGSRVDLRLFGPSGTCYVEVKSVTLVENGVGLFPDAPTTRGRRHVLELRQAVGEGVRAAVVFVIQRPDARALSPHWRADPDFCDALLEAAAAGVEVYAFGCAVSRAEVTLAARVPVLLERPAEEDGA